MGHASATEFLQARWGEILRDPTLVDLAFKVELDRAGLVQLSPTSTRHGILQARIIRELGDALPRGTVISECPILTEIGVRVPDVAWASSEFMAREGEPALFTRAPEICVEIRSPSNTPREFDDKVRAYLAAGAVEVWIVEESGERKMFGAEGQVGASSFGV